MDILDDYIHECSTKEFEWGEHDCALFAARGVDLQCGTGYVEAIKKKFPVRSEREFARLMLRHRSDFKKLITWVGQLPERTLDQLQRGDPVLCNPQRPTLGLWLPPIAMAPGPKGLIGYGRLEIITGWSLDTCRKLPQ